MKTRQTGVRDRLLAMGVILALGTGLLSATAYGQTGSGDYSVPDTIQLPERFVNTLMRQADYGQRLLLALRHFERIDLDGDGVTQEDLDRGVQIKAAKARGRILQTFYAYDWNADGVVTLEEAEKFITWDVRHRVVRHNTNNIQRKIERRVRRKLEPLEKADVDGDGKLTAAELFNLAKSQVAARRQGKPTIFNRGLEGVIMSFDFDSDGVVAAEEFMAAISKMTPESTLGRLTNSAIRVVQPGCDAPKVKPGEKMVLVGVSDATALSSVATIGQDSPVSAAEVFIEEGKDPLYVVLTSRQAIIWKFSGATNRVRHVILNSAVGSFTGVAGSGLVGLERSKVSFVTGQKCLREFDRTGGLEEARTKAQIRDLTGAEPDYVLGQHRVGFVALPNGPLEKLARNRQILTRDTRHVDWLRFAPSGLMKFDASDVVSQQPANDYEVLPYGAGLAQLLDEAKIERLGKRSFKILQKIRIPAGLAGGHSVEFLLAKGVPAPIGDPAHSCILSEATGRRVGGPAHCR